MSKKYMKITSVAKKLNKMIVPSFKKSVLMKKFDISSKKNLSTEEKKVVDNMIGLLNPKPSGVAWLTIDSRKISAGETHRKPGTHIERNYSEETGLGNNGSWGNADSNGGGMIYAASKHGCNGYLGAINSIPDENGGISEDLSGLEKIKLEENTVYYANSQFIHTPLKFNQETPRTIVRITLPASYPIQNKNILNKKFQ